MDSNIVSGTGTGIDAFAMVEFGSNPPLRTRVRTSKGKGNLRVAFNEALYLPVWVPTMTNRIAISVWDQDPGALAPPPLAEQRAPHTHLLCVPGVVPYVRVSR